MRATGGGAAAAIQLTGHDAAARLLPPTLAARGIGLRHEGEGDQEFLRALFLSTRDERLLAAIPEAMRDCLLEQQFRARRSQFRRHFADALFAVVEAQGRPVGRLCLARGPEGLHVVDIAILPGWQGGGLGRALLLAIQDEAAAAGARVTLRVDMLNGGAQRLYHRLGFRVAAEQPPDLLLEWRP